MKRFHDNGLLSNMASRLPINSCSSGRKLKMPTHTLFTAFAIAQARIPCAGSVPAKSGPRPADDTTFLNALRNCATDRDQIIQRRIGALDQ